MKYVIIGAGPAGVRAAETLRQEDATGDITLVSGEPGAPYARMAIPYILTGRIDENGAHQRQNAGHFDGLQDPLPQPQGGPDPRRSERRQGRSGRRLQPRLRPPAGRDRVIAELAAHPGHRPRRLCHLLDARGCSRDRSQAQTRRACRDDGWRLRGRRHHEIAGGKRRAAVGDRRSPGSDPAVDDDAGGQRDDSALAREPRRERHHQGSQRAHRTGAAAGDGQPDARCRSHHPCDRRASQRVLPRRHGRRDRRGHRRRRPDADHSPVHLCGGGRGPGA